MAEDAAAPIDDDSIEMLGDARKGKARQFVMMCKGVRILKMYVFKKGMPNAKVQAAKKEGFSGSPFWGVVTGKGQNLRFELSSEDGFDKPPGKELILKDFLKSKADFKCDPEYVIVPKLSAVEDDDEATGPNKTPEVPPDAPPPPPPPPDSQSAQRRAKIGEAFAKLSPKVPDFVRAFPDRRVEILKPVKRVKDFLDDPDSADVDGARDAIKVVSQLLTSMAGAPKGSSIPEAPPLPDSSTTDQSNTSEAPPISPELRQRVMRAGETAAKLKAPPDVLALVRQAAQQLKAGQSIELVETLETLEARLTTLERSAQVQQEVAQAKGKGNVRLRALKIDWERSRARAESELERLVEEIESHPDVVFDPRRDEIQAAARNLIKELPRFDNRLESLLDKAGKSDSPDESTALEREALDVIDGYLAEIERRPLLRNIEDSFFGKASISSELSKTLVGLREVLASRA